jgi:hypothetical protein
MSILRPCPACFTGDHERHDRDHGIRSGLIGGAFCACSGECTQDHADGAGDEARPLNVVGSAGEPNPSVPRYEYAVRDPLGDSIWPCDDLAHARLMFRLHGWEPVRRLISSWERLP